MSEIDEDILSEYPSLSPETDQLTETQRRILVGYIKNGLSKDPKSDSKLAESLGYNRKTLYLARMNPQWAKAYRTISQSLAITDIGLVIEHLMRNSEAGDTQASKVLLQFTGMLPNVTKNLNLNMASIKRYDNVEEIIDAMIIRLGELGISAETLTERFMKLKKAGRF